MSVQRSGARSQCFLIRSLALMKGKNITLRLKTPSPSPVVPRTIIAQRYLKSWIASPVYYREEERDTGDIKTLRRFRGNGASVVPLVVEILLAISIAVLHWNHRRRRGKGVAIVDSVVWFSLTVAFPLQCLRVVILKAPRHHHGVFSLFRFPTYEAQLTYLACG